MGEGNDPAVGMIRALRRSQGICRRMVRPDRAPRSCRCADRPGGGVMRRRRRVVGYDPAVGMASTSRPRARQVSEWIKGPSPRMKHVHGRNIAFVGQCGRDG